MTDAFTVRSWNNTNPVDFSDFQSALDAAKARAAAEGKLVKIRDNQLAEARDVSPDGFLSKWQNDAPWSAKDYDYENDAEDFA